MEAQLQLLFYEIGNNHSFGIASDITSKYFFAGINVQAAKFAIVFNSPHSPPGNSNYRYSFCAGVHAGARQRIARHLYAVEYIGSNIINLVGKMAHYEQTRFPVPPYWYYTSINESFHIYYFRAGLSYELPLKKGGVKMASNPE